MGLIGQSAVTFDGNYDTTDFASKSQQFNLTNRDIQEIGKNPDAGSLDETQSYLNTGKAVGQTGSFLKMTMNSYLHIGSILAGAGIIGIVVAIFWWLWQVTAWAVIAGFIIERLIR